MDEKDVLKALKKCYDPELGISVVDLGLIYDVKVSGKSVHVKMTLTTPGCPLHAFIVEDVRKRVKGLKGVEDVEVELVWDPPWTPARMTKEAKKKLGFK